MDRSLLRRARHVLLVRDPAAVISSFAEVLEPTLTVRLVVSCFLCKGCVRLFSCFSRA